MAMIVVADFLLAHCKWRLVDDEEVASNLDEVLCWVTSPDLHQPSPHESHINLAADCYAMWACTLWPWTLMELTTLLLHMRVAIKLPVVDGYPPGQTKGTTSSPTLHRSLHALSSSLQNHRAEARHVCQAMCLRCCSAIRRDRSHFNSIEFLTCTGELGVVFPNLCTQSA